MAEERSRLAPVPVSRFNMKAARYYGPGDVRVETIPEPELKPGQVKLKVRDLCIKGTMSLTVDIIARLVRK